MRFTVFTNELRDLECVLDYRSVLPQKLLNPRRKTRTGRKIALILNKMVEKFVLTFPPPSELNLLPTTSGLSLHHPCTFFQAGEGNQHRIQYSAENITTRIEGELINLGDYQ